MAKNEARNKNCRLFGIYERVGADVTGTCKPGSDMSPLICAPGKPAITNLSSGV